MTIGQRLKRFIENVYGSQSHYAKITGITPTVLSRYIQEKNAPGVDVLLKFKKTGLSIDWLLDGQGSMLLPDYDFMDNQETGGAAFGQPLKRLRKWISENYGTKEKFAVTTNIDLRILESTLDSELVPDPNFLKMINMAGCNISWLSTGKGSPYANNHIGVMLEMRKGSSEEDNIDLKKLDLPDMSKLTTSHFYDIIKHAVKKEIEHLKGKNDD